MAEFLFEIGLEEVPARMLAGAERELRERVVRMLERERLVVMGPGEEVEVRSFATPRRLAVLVGGVAERQEDAREEMMGPSAKVAFKDGLAGPAAVAFARKAGVAVEALERVETAKGEYVRAVVTKAGRTAAEVIAVELPQELAGIYWAKTMRWLPSTGPTSPGGNPGRTGSAERFVRPVRWMVAMLGDAVVPVSFAGKTAGRVTYGHRVLDGDAPVEVHAPGEYEAVLERVHVVAAVEARRQRIRKALDRVCRGVTGARWREDHELVETVTQLTEWPTVVMGGFEREYLALPEEVLVTVMRDHQKYFAVEGAGQRDSEIAGKRDSEIAGERDSEMAGERTAGSRSLAPHFLTVLNTEVDTVGEAVIRHGNERVLRARFNDARFFWEFDQRVPLEERVALLEKVTFQRELGSYAAKTTRVRRVAAELSDRVRDAGGEVDAAAVDEAARLAKTDLTTELVKEFTELQGVVGGLYARVQGVSEAAALAIYDQYRPEGADDALPRSAEGAVLAVADKADTIAGMFALGMEPTGSKDPFALRRAANGIVRVLAETGVRLTLQEVAEAAAENRMELIVRMLGFFRERVEFYLRETKGQAYDVVAAVVATGFEDVRDAVARAEVVTAVRGAAGGADFAAVSAAFKRMRNILEQARAKGMVVPGTVDESLLLEPEETALAERAADLAGQVEAMRAARDYRGALEAIATLRPQVDAFFDAVMVMVTEERVRGNRLALLARVLGDFSRVADFSEIVVAG